jgi:hypothetical protein
MSLHGRLWPRVVVRVFQVPALEESSGPYCTCSDEGQKGSVTDESVTQAEVEMFIIRAAIVRKYVSLSVRNGSWVLSRGTIRLNSTAFDIITSSDVRRADDKGDIASRARMLINAAHTKHQLVLPTALRLKRASRKTDHHALGVSRTVPRAVAPWAGALASLAKGSVLFVSSKRMTINCV